MMAKEPTVKNKIRAHELILDAAERVFGELGIKGATTREIARVAGVNETTLFRNFSSKDALLKAVVEKLQVEAQNGVYDTPWTYDLMTDLEQFTLNYTRFLIRHEGLVRTCIAEFGRLSEEAREIFRHPRVNLQEMLVVYFKAQQGRQVLRADLEPIKVAYGLLNIALMGILKDEMPFDRTEYLKMMANVYARGIQNPEIQKPEKAGKK